MRKKTVLTKAASVKTASVKIEPLTAEKIAPVTQTKAQRQQAMAEQLAQLPHFLANSAHCRRNFLSVALICCLRGLLARHFGLIKLNQNEEDKPVWEAYRMDKEIMRCLIRDLVETGDYSLEGLAHYLHVPADAVLDTVSTEHGDLSMPFGASLFYIYVEARPALVEWMFKELAIFAAGDRQKFFDLVGARRKYV